MPCLMKTYIKKFIIGGLVCFFTFHVSSTYAQRFQMDFNSGWKFAKGEQTGAKDPDFDDSSWETVRIPHDWAISGPFNMDEKWGHQGRLPWRGEGWYRKSFNLNEVDQDKRIIFLFDGIMSHPEVYVNGQKAGSWGYGYNSFMIDATDYVNHVGENVISVSVNTTKMHSRWYPGAGIYRKVTMYVLDQVHVPLWQYFVTTPQVNDQSATIRVQYSIKNTSKTDQQLKMVTMIYNPEGYMVGKESRKLKVEGGNEQQQEIGFVIPNAKCWDIDYPNIYKARTIISRGKKILDDVEADFGIRTIEFTAEDGFHLNGGRVQLKGVNLHHDQGVLGAKMLPRALERQLEIMKDMGCNAIRTSHNPPAPELVELCDRMGFVVFYEVFDKWGPTAGYEISPTEFVKDHAEKEIRNAVLRDRNHPSIVIYSIGNEIGEIEDNNFGNSAELVNLMADYFLKYDPSRPITFGCMTPGSLRKDKSIMGPLHATSWNYGRKYVNARDIYHNKGIIYSESASAVSTRGFYELPLPANKTDYSSVLQVDSYDFNSAWGPRDIPDWDLYRMEEDYYVAGEFVWTGFDYLGEPTPFPKEARSSYFGIVDLCGIPKDRYFLYRSHWAPEKTTIHILPHWNWPERKGMQVPVFVYTNGDEAELFQNGKSLGRRKKKDRSNKIGGRVLNLAMHKPAKASSELTTGWWPRAANRANDGDSFYGWTAESNRMPQWWQVDLGKEVAISTCHIHWETVAENYEYQLFLSDDGENWHKVADEKDFEQQGDKAWIDLNMETSFLKINVTAAFGRPADSNKADLKSRDSREWASGSPDPSVAGIREVDLRSPENVGEENPYYDVVDSYRLRWMDVVYEPGEIRVVVYKDGIKIGEKIMQTAGKPARLKLSPDHVNIKSDGDDLSYVLVEMVDKNGVLCPLADNLVNFDVSGPAEIAGVGNGDPMGYDILTDKRHALFFGKAMLILRSKRGKTGNVEITASCFGLPDATTTVMVE